MILLKELQRKNRERKGRKYPSKIKPQANNESIYGKTVGLFSNYSQKLEEM